MILACQHGSLARACELCFRDGEIKELRGLLGECLPKLSDDYPCKSAGVPCLKCRVGFAVAGNAPRPVSEVFADLRALGREVHAPTCEYRGLSVPEPWECGCGCKSESVPGAPRAPADCVCPDASHFPGTCPTPPGTPSPAEELAEAARLLDDGMTMGLGSEGRDAWYPTREDAARFRAALAKWRAR